MAKRIKVERTRNAGSMTESAFFSKIRSTLRSGFRYWKPMQIVLQKASRPYKGTNKRQKKEFQCAICKEWYKRDLVEIDHIEECGSLKNWDDIVPFIKRLTAEGINSYQILCKKCHLLKTKKNKEEKNAE